MICSCVCWQRNTKRTKTSDLGRRRKWKTKKRPFYESPMYACARLPPNKIVTCKHRWLNFGVNIDQRQRLKIHIIYFPYPFSSFSPLTFANIRMRSPGGLQMWSRFPQQLSRPLIHFPPYHCASVGQINDASRPLTSPGNPGVLNRGANINLQLNLGIIRQNLLSECVSAAQILHLNAPLGRQLNFS